MDTLFALLGRPDGHQCPLLSAGPWVRPRRPKQLVRSKFKIFHITTKSPGLHLYLNKININATVDLVLAVAVITVVRGEVDEGHATGTGQVASALAFMQRATPVVAPAGAPVTTSPHPPTRSGPAPTLAFRAPWLSMTRIAPPPPGQMARPAPPHHPVLRLEDGDGACGR